jgi:Zn-dependent protease
VIERWWVRLVHLSRFIVKRRFSLGRWFGIQVFIDWSSIPTFVFAWWTFVSVNRRLLADADMITIFGISTLSAAGLFASFGAHELIRVTAARRLFGVPVHKLLLFVVGGVSDTERAAASSPRAQALSAVIAPAVSLLAALVIFIGTAIASAPFPRALDDLDRLGPPGVLLLELAASNAFVALINLLPAYPLDGGRILRALLWRLTGNLERATRLATWTGQVAGFTLVTLGIGGTVAATTVHNNAIYFMAGFVWLAFIGWFVASAAAQGFEVETSAPKPS